MTKKAVPAMNPKCNTNGRTDADKYPGLAAGSDSMGTLATSPLITFFLLLTLICSVMGSEGCYSRNDGDRLLYPNAQDHTCLYAV